MYSLSQDNWDFKKKMISEPAALEVLVSVTKDAPVLQKEGGKGKGKKEKGDKQEEQDQQLLLKLLVCGTSEYMSGRSTC
jgi:hypothetical protein